jgi:hypothetical protein
VLRTDALGGVGISSRVSSGRRLTIEAMIQL